MKSYKAGIILIFSIISLILNIMNGFIVNV